MTQDKPALRQARPAAKEKPSEKQSFDLKVFLGTEGAGRVMLKFRKHQKIFVQGDASDSVFYIRKGKVKLTVVSQLGKEAVIAILGADEFCGEASLTGQLLRLSTARAMTDCDIMKLSKAAMVNVTSSEPAFSEMFIEHLLMRTIRVEEDLVDQLFNSSEKRLARALVACEFWQRRSASENHRQNQSGNACGNDRYDPFTRQSLHEQISQTRLH